MSVDVTDAKKALADANLIIARHNGYVESENISEDPNLGYENMNVWISVRIPSEKLDTAIDAFSKLGKEVSRTMTTQNITERYVDNESRIKNLKAREESLRSLMSKAANIKDLLEIDREITSVRTTLDSLEGMKKSWDSQVSYSMIELQLIQAKPDYTFFDKIVNGIADSLRSIGEILLKSIYVLAFAAPYMIGAAVAYYAVTGIRSRKGKK
jgi:hypothetical protein